MDHHHHHVAMASSGGSMMLWYAEQMAQWERQNERRQLFLKSYQFSAPSPAPRTFSKRVSKSLVQARCLVWSRLRRLPRLVWSSLRRRGGGGGGGGGGGRRWSRLVVLAKSNGGNLRSKRGFKCLC